MRLVSEQGRQPTEVAKELGICIDTLRSWLKASGIQMGQASRQNREQQRIRELEAENRSLRKQLGEKEEVIDILKKSVWNAQEDFTGGENALVVIDGSGSMYGGARPLPAAVALSLGIYFAERNTGAFRNHFITFSRTPRLVEIQGRDIFEKVYRCAKYNEVVNTNLAAVFKLILRTAVKHRILQEEMPKKLYIISDMEFDWCVEDGGKTNFEHAKDLFARCGYRLPEVVFWNVASRNRQQPVTKNEQGVALVSGCTPRLFSMLSAGLLTPYDFMLDVLGGERYAMIAA